jgi:hypothetical protein
MTTKRQKVQSPVAQISWLKGLFFIRRKALGIEYKGLQIAFSESATSFRFFHIFE